ncbi:hypothetical protein ACSBR1_004635 [Camellia fascicularis]
MAIQKANGLWCDDKALKVKEAEFGKDPTRRNRDSVQADTHGGRRRKEVGSIMTNMGKPGLWKEWYKSYADVVHNGPHKKYRDHAIVAHEEGNVWLYDSLMVKLKNYYAFSEFQKAALIKGQKKS